MEEREPVEVEPNAMPEPDSTRRCGNPNHRVIPIRFPYFEAQAVRAKLIDQLGAERVSRLRRTDGPWTVVICSDCARDDVRGADVEQTESQVGP
jgi:hypothetical protein